jgi:hypothetical protein
MDLLFREFRQGLHGQPALALLAQALHFVEAILAGFQPSGETGHPLQFGRLELAISMHGVCKQRRFV